VIKARHCLLHAELHHLVAITLAVTVLVLNYLIIATISLNSQFFLQRKIKQVFNKHSTWCNGGGFESIRIAYSSSPLVQL
jgi:hypothetical protein